MGYFWSAGADPCGVHPGSASRVSESACLAHAVGRLWGSITLSLLSQSRVEENHLLVPCTAQLANLADATALV
jgi:hypothetical protein